MEVVVLNRQRAHKVSTKALCSFFERLVAFQPPDAESLAVCLVSEDGIRRLNREFRRIDRSTDVLAFPCGPNPSGHHHLGDIVISVPAAARQARRAGHSLSRELRVLAVHGYLHLLGYDHETDDGRMARTQRRLLRRLLGPSRVKRER